MAKTWVAGDQVLAADLNMMVVPTGAILPYGGKTAPSNWLLCNGAAVSRTTYADLFAALFQSVGTVTITIATPGVVSKTAHGLATGDAIYLTTTGALPTGLTVNTRYWVIKNDANSFWLATSLANALAGTKIATTGSQSGVHTAVDAPHGIGDGSTTFNLPSMGGVIPVGVDQAQTEFAGAGQTGGEKTHTLTIAEMPSHNHDIEQHTSAGSGAGFQWFTTNAPQLGTTQVGNRGGDGAHNNIQPYIALNYIIRY